MICNRQPDGGKFVDDGSTFGAVEYDHKLTEGEIDDFSFMPITEAKELEGKVFEKPFMKSEITYRITSVDDNGTVNFQKTYKGKTEDRSANYFEFIKNLGDKVKEISNSQNVQFSIGVDISQNQSPAEQLATQAVFNALDMANIPVEVVSEDELKALGGKAQLSKKQKRLLDAATMKRDSILSNPATDTSEQSQPIESSMNDAITDSKDIANVQKELDSLAKSWLNKPNRVNGVISDVTLVLGLENENDGTSRYSCDWL